MWVDDPIPCRFTWPDYSQLTINLNPAHIPQNPYSPATQETTTVAPGRSQVPSPNGPATAAADNGSGGGGGGTAATAAAGGGGTATAATAAAGGGGGGGDPTCGSYARVSSLCREVVNEVALACVDDRRFMVLMAMAKRRGVQEVKQLMAVAEALPEAVARVQRTVGQAVAAGRGAGVAEGTAAARAGGFKAGGRGESLAVAGEGGGGEVGRAGTSDGRGVTGCVTVSLEDPLNPGRVIKHPGRFSNSSMLQPFDLDTYLREVSGGGAFHCVRCSLYPMHCCQS